MKLSYFLLEVKLKVVIIGTVASSIFGFRMPLIKELLGKGHSILVFAIDFNLEQKKELLALGVSPVDYQLSRSGLNPFADLKTMLTLKNTLKEVKPDIVLSYFMKPVIYGSIAAYLAGVPKIIAMLEGLGYTYTPSLNGFSFKKKILQYIQGCLFSISFRATNEIIFLNPDDPKDLSKYVLFYNYSHKINVLGGIGLDISEFSYSAVDITKPIRFVFIARLLAEKGIYQLIDAIKIVKKKYPTAELLVLGNLDKESPSSLKSKELESLIEQKIIVYPGHVSNVTEWLSESHVFVLPSYYREGVPRSTQEAMAIGRPILTTDVPGCRETVVEGENGYMVPAFDVNSLVEKMNWFIEHPEYIEPMGKVSRRLAEEKFDVHKVNEKMLQIMGL